MKFKGKKKKEALRKRTKQSSPWPQMGSTHLSQALQSICRRSTDASSSSAISVR